MITDSITAIPMEPSKNGTWHSKVFHQTLNEINENNIFVYLRVKSEEKL